MPDGIERIDDLAIVASDGTKLFVPLLYETANDPKLTDVWLFDGGIVWEDERYALSFGVRSTIRIRRATLCVNDFQELWTKMTFEDMMLGGTRVWSYIFSVPTSDRTSRPFQLTCGFARVEARIELEDGTNLLFTTPDIVAFDEPSKGGETGERAEEANVREMFRALVKVRDNQAAEWMFANEGMTLAGRQLSADENTDWAYAPISLRLQVASDALDCVYDGLESKSDAFPTTCDSDAPSPAGPCDTPENQAVRALLASMEVQIRHSRDAMESLADKSRGQVDVLERLKDEAFRQRGRTQSLPALTMLSYHADRECRLCAALRDLHERVIDMLDLVDDPNDGVGPVTEVEFRVPPRAGIFCEDATYEKLHEAMSVWDACAHMPIGRNDVLLHALKPDRLFEYSALHKMLDSLWSLGFAEADTAKRAIDRYAYDLANWYQKYENETRCANTYHLVRAGRAGSAGQAGQAGQANATHVDLYYQPVFYLDKPAENDVDLHRVPRSEPRDDEQQGEFWTPDYLLVIRRGDTTKTYVMDAKYRPRHTLCDALNRCSEKYLSQAARGHERPGTGIDGVVILAGRLDAPARTEKYVQIDGATYLHMIAPFNKNAGRRKVRQFFEALGLQV